VLVYRPTANVCSDKVTLCVCLFVCVSTEKVNLLIIVL
jgi:hypothetical protein